MSDEKPYDFRPEAHWAAKHLIHGLDEVETELKQQGATWTDLQDGQFLGAILDISRRFIAAADDATAKQQLLNSTDVITVTDRLQALMIMFTLAVRKKANELKEAETGEQ